MTHRRIQETLSGIEAEHDVRILYACESGSRGWGFDSADSDWDVRFIYCHPRDWYLNFEDIEQKIGVDTFLSELAQALKNKTYHPMMGSLPDTKARTCANVCSPWVCKVTIMPP